MAKKVFVSELTRNKNWKEGLKDITARAKKELGDNPCDLAVFFLSETYENFDPQAFSKHLLSHLPCRVVIGCNSSGIIGNRNEVEMEPGISLMAMHLPGVRLYPFYVSAEDSQRLETGSE